MKKHAKLVLFFISCTLLLKDSPLPVFLSFCDTKLAMSRIKLIVYYCAEAVQYGDIVMSHFIARQINRHFLVKSSDAYRIPTNVHRGVHLPCITVLSLDLGSVSIYGNYNKRDNTFLIFLLEKEDIERPGNLNKVNIL